MLLLGQQKAIKKTNSYHYDESLKRTEFSMRSAKDTRKTSIPNLLLQRITTYTSLCNGRSRSNPICAILLYTITCDDRNASLTVNYAKTLKHYYRYCYVFKYS